MVVSVYGKRQAELFRCRRVYDPIPMVGYIFACYAFKLRIFNVGGMTSTPALGTLINVAGTGDVAAAYASTYPVALVLIVLFLKVVVPML